MLYYIAEMRDDHSPEELEKLENFSYRVEESGAYRPPQLIEARPAGRALSFVIPIDRWEDVLAVGFAEPEAPSAERRSMMLRQAAWMECLPERYTARFRLREATLSNLYAMATRYQCWDWEMLEEQPACWALDREFGIEHVRMHLYPDGDQRPSVRECVIPEGRPTVPLYLAAKSDSPSLGAAVHEALRARHTGAVGAEGPRCYVVAGLALFLLESMGKVTEAWHAAGLLGGLRLTLVEPAPWGQEDFGPMLLNVRGTSVGMMVTRRDLSKRGESVRAAIRQWAEADTQGPLFVCVDTQGNGPEAVATVLSWLPDVPVTVVLDDNALTPGWTSSEHGAKAVDHAIATLCAPDSHRAKRQQGGAE